MADPQDTSPEPTGWDRVGQFFGDMATVGQAMADRNLRLWNEVSQHLKQDKYTADDMAQDAASMMGAAMDNMQAAWTFWTRVPEREAVATALPLAVLYYHRRATQWPPRKTSYTVSEPVWIRVPVVEGEALPQKAEIELLGPEPGAGDKLKELLDATLGDAGRAYKLQGGTPKLPGVHLTGGTYTGLVYLKNPPQIRPLASIRIIVE